MDFQLHGARVDRMSFSAISFGNEVVAETGPLGVAAVMFPLAGTCTVWSAGQKATLMRGRAAVLSPAFGTRTHWSADCRQAFITFNPEFVDDHVTRITGSLPSEPLRFELALDAAAGHQSHLVNDLLIPLLSEFDRGNPMFHAPRYVEDIEDLAASALLSSQPHNYSI
jgi:hypothetical protein